MQGFRVRAPLHIEVEIQWQQLRETLFADLLSKVRIQYRMIIIQIKVSLQIGGCLAIQSLSL
jgi:hypothetical protein